MPVQLPNELTSLVNERLATGIYANEEEVIRLALKALEESEEDLRTTRAAIEYFDRGGEGIPVAEAFAQARRAVTTDE